MERWLRRRGWSITIAQNGQEVLDALGEHTFDLILMDIQMPKMDGILATKTIREREEHTHRHIPIIALTAHAMEGISERFSQCRHGCLCRQTPYLKHRSPPSKPA